MIERAVIEGEFVTAIRALTRREVRPASEVYSGVHEVGGKLLDSAAHAWFP